MATANRWLKPEVSFFSLSFSIAFCLAAEKTIKKTNDFTNQIFISLNVYLQVYPLFAAVGVGVGICGMQLVRNITTTNPEVSYIFQVLQNMSV